MYIRHVLHIHVLNIVFYYPIATDVRRGEYCGLGVFLLQYSLLSIHEKYYIIIAQT